MRSGHGAAGSRPPWAVSSASRQLPCEVVPITDASLGLPSEKSSGSKPSDESVSTGSHEIPRFTSESAGLRDDAARLGDVGCLQI